MSEKIKGTVTWFDRSKGFGFIKRKQGNDILVQTRALQNTDTLLAGQHVEFNVTSGKQGGEQADNVVVFIE